MVTVNLEDSQFDSRQLYYGLEEKRRETEDFNGFNIAIGGTVTRTMTVNRPEGVLMVRANIHYSFSSINGRWYPIIGSTGIQSSAGVHDFDLNVGVLSRSDNTLDIVTKYVNRLAAAVATVPDHTVTVDIRFMSFPWA